MVWLIAEAWGVWWSRLVMMDWIRTSMHVLRGLGIPTAEIIHPFMHVILTSQIVSPDSGGADRSTFQIDNFRPSIFPQPTLCATSINPIRYMPN